MQVNLPATPVSDFSGAGSQVGLTPFNLSFLNCPPGLASIDYYFTPTTGVLDDAQGVLALDSTSTARGIGIQLLMTGSQPMQFGIANRYRLDAYDSTQTTNYNVSLQVQYRQTGTQISPGSANTAITFTMVYK